MAKISPVAIKYMIHARFEAEGNVEKPDVIGAVFGQTEGLLGNDLEMRDLQKEGKIGRIEVNTTYENSKTIGEILIPSALDKTETTLLAAAIETIERVGPSNAKIEVLKVEDVRENKRQYIFERAKKLLENIQDNMPKTREIAQNMKSDVRANKIKEYGEEKLPAGNLEGNEIIVVEGRADVVNLLRNNVENVIGMDGTKLPKTIRELSYSKEITLFCDGDRGGKLIAKNVIDNARVDFVAFAPDGKEVEELTDKEILMSLRKKMPVQEFLRYARFEESRESRYPRERYEKRQTYREERPVRVETEEVEKETSLDVESNKEKLKEMLNEVQNSTNALILNSKLEVISRVPTRRIFSSLDRISSKPYAIVVNKATGSIVRGAEENNIKNIVAKNFEYSETSNVNLISL